MCLIEHFPCTHWWGFIDVENEFEEEQEEVENEIDEHESVDALFVDEKSCIWRFIVDCNTGEHVGVGGTNECCEGILIHIESTVEWINVDFVDLKEWLRGGWFSLSMNVVMMNECVIMYNMYIQYICVWLNVTLL